MFNKKFVIDLSSKRLRKNILICGSGLIILVVLLAYAGLKAMNSDSGESEPQLAIAESETEKVTEKKGSIYVDVSGAVNQPSVIVLAEGSRVIDAIEAAGGLNEDAYINGINRAEILTDGAYIYIPTNKEVSENGIASAAGTSGSPGSVSAGTQASGALGNRQDKININTADSSKLQELTGVGPAIAERIIDYRESNGRFNSVEDLKNVSGIGEKTFEKLAPHIVV